MGAKYLHAKESYEKAKQAKEASGAYAQYVKEKKEHQPAYVARYVNHYVDRYPLKSRKKIKATQSKRSGAYAQYLKETMKKPKEDVNSVKAYVEHYPVKTHGAYDYMKAQKPSAMMP